MEPILSAKGLVKRYGRVTALDHCDFELMPGEILGVIGDNGAGKSTLIKALCGAVTPDEGSVYLDGKPISFTSPIDARKHGIETVYQTLAMSPALSIADNMFMGRELRKPGIMGSVFKQLDKKRMQEFAREKLSELGLMTIQNINQAVETLSGGQRQGVAVARAAAFGSKVIILDEPTAALGVKESRRVLELIQDVKSRGIPIILISHNMPHVFEVCDRIHIHRLGKRLTVIDPKDHEMSDAVAYMTGAKKPDVGRVQPMTLEHTTNRIFDALSAHLQSDKRCLVAIAGPPAVGKSTLAECLCDKLNQAKKKAAIVPMDGFHMDNETLIAKGLLHRKGAPMTFDVSAFTSTLESLLKEDEVSIPMFDRAKDCTIPNAAKITGGDQYVIVEGNYLLLDQEDWRDLSQFWGYSVFVEADFDELESRLINRWLDHGLDHTAAKKRAHDNDIVNAATVLNHRMPSDLTLIN